MSYLDYPRIHFSGQFLANPATLNNTPLNYDPKNYFLPHDLKNVALYWNPRGDGGFAFVSCKVTLVEYGPGESASTPEEDPIIGAEVVSSDNAGFHIDAAIVDLDPMQQNVSEIWGLRIAIKIGDKTGEGLTVISGKLAPTPFCGIWLQSQGQNAPQSSASGSAVYQANMDEIKVADNTSNSRFIKMLKASGPTALSLNFNTNEHNNAPKVYLFNDDTFKAMAIEDEDGKYVPEEVLILLEPLKEFRQYIPEQFKKWNQSVPKNNPKGGIPTKRFLLFLLKRILKPYESETGGSTVGPLEGLIMKRTQMPYIPATNNPFPHGTITGTIGLSCKEAPTYFVPSRVLRPYINVTGSGPKRESTCYYAPFLIDQNNHLTINLGNSLPTKLPGTHPFVAELNDLWLVAFRGGKIDLGSCEKLVQIPYSKRNFLLSNAGFFSHQLSHGYEDTPLGLVSCDSAGNPTKIFLQENQNGYSIRADKFVYRMNPGVPGSPDKLGGDSAGLKIYALKFGKPIPDGFRIKLKMKNPEQALAYISQTAGTGGTPGIANLSIPQDALSFSQSADVINGVASFELKCTSPGNPRGPLNGQVYFLDYHLFKGNDKQELVQDTNDVISVKVFGQEALEPGLTTLQQYGRIYPIMSFLANPKSFEGPSGTQYRNLVQNLLSKPLEDIQHMPVTRDLSAADRDRIIAWIDEMEQ